MLSSVRPVSLDHLVRSRRPHVQDPRSQRRHAPPARRRLVPLGPAARRAQAALRRQLLLARRHPRPRHPASAHPRRQGRPRRGRAGRQGHPRQLGRRDRRHDGLVGLQVRPKCTTYSLSSLQRRLAPADRAVVVPPCPQRLEGRHELARADPRQRGARHRHRRRPAWHARHGHAAEDPRARYVLVPLDRSTGEGSPSSRRR